ncbi:hypothetical protein BB560_004302, partial [Smittium megazygosporum]
MDKVAIKLENAKAAIDENRAQLLEIKDKLVQVMGQAGQVYWDKLRAFLTGKLNMQEFERFFTDGSIGENAKLHNYLILSILKNATSKVRPESGVSYPGFTLSKKRSRERYKTDYEVYQINGLNSASQDTLDSADFSLVKINRPVKDSRETESWNTLKKIVKSMSVHDRKALKYLLKNKKPSPAPIQDAIKFFERITLPYPPSKLPQNCTLDLAKGVLAPLCYETKSVPEKKELHARMVGIALENGLDGGVSENAVDLLTSGLIFHLRNIITNMINKVRRDTGYSDIFDQPNKLSINDSFHNSIVVPDALYQDNEAPSSKRLKIASKGDEILGSNRTLYLKDLLFSLKLSPHVAVENPLSVEQGILTVSRKEKYSTAVEADKILASSSVYTNPKYNSFFVGSAADLDKVQK